jgi:hypothetical protein
MVCVLVWFSGNFVVIPYQWDLVLLSVSFSVLIASSYWIVVMGSGFKYFPVILTILYSS